MIQMERYWEDRLVFPRSKDPKPAPDVHDDDLEDDEQYTIRTLPPTIDPTRNTPAAATPTPEGAATAETTTLRSDFQRKREERLRAQQADQAASVGHSGWRAELGAYRQTIEEEVSAETDLCEWWQDHAHTYPTVARIAIDFIRRKPHLSTLNSYSRAVLGLQMTSAPV